MPWECGGVAEMVAPLLFLNRKGRKGRKEMNL
jgi:hypothetical protein